jgi:hypothetical protein
MATTASRSKTMGGLHDDGESNEALAVLRLMARSNLAGRESR